MGRGARSGACPQQRTCSRQLFDNSHILGKEKFFELKKKLNLCSRHLVAYRICSRLPLDDSSTKSPLIDPSSVENQ